MKYLNYPKAQQGPPVKNEWPDAKNPVLRGAFLRIGASLVSSSSLLQQIFWTNAKFNTLRNIEALEDYSPRHDGVVVPLAEAESSQAGDEAVLLAREELAGGAYWSVRDYHAMYLSGKVTPTQVAKALLPLITSKKTSHKGGHAEAFMEIHPEEILAAAAASTKRFQSGQPLGLLDGIPVGVKDQVDIRGYKRMVGSTKNHTKTLRETSWCVQQWLDEGAILMGTLSMHEYGLGTNNNNPHHGTPLNPFNENYYTGGSSGGSAYAAGSGLLPVVLGADGGGSIRIPSSYCGIFGLKTSHGRVSGEPTLESAISTGVIGPMCANMDDVAIAYRSMSRPNPDHAPSSFFAVAQPIARLERKVIGVCRDWVARADPEVKQFYDAALVHLKGQGYEIVDITIPLLPQGQMAHAMTILGEIAAEIRDDVKDLTPANKILVSVGNKTPAMDFMLAQKMRNLLMQHLSYLWKQHPGMIILTPTTPNCGWHIANGAADLVSGTSDENMSLKGMTYVWMANFLGNPALTVPMGYGKAVKGSEVPVGLLALGHWGGEEDLIAFGKEWEETFLSSRRRRPRDGRWVDVLGLASGRAVNTSPENSGPIKTKL